jgi:alpha-tubulin suppressor-like RCC1 family protein
VVNASVAFTTVSASDANTCALAINGTVYCWGDKSNGQVGDNLSSGSTATPTPVMMPSGVTFTAISLGHTHACALSSAGSAYCWGANFQGELGNGTEAESTVPTSVVMPGANTFTSITAALGHTCALTSAATAYCWGRNSQGQMGNGTIVMFEKNLIPIPVTMP